MGETRGNGVSTAKVFKIAMDVIANRFPGKKNAPDFKILHRPIQSQNFTGVISPQGKEATVTFTAFCRAGGAGHQFPLGSPAFPLLLFYARRDEFHPVFTNTQGRRAIEAHGPR